MYITENESFTLVHFQLGLRGFERVSLAAGDTNTVCLSLSYEDFTYWNEKTGDFEIEAGAFEIQVGASSQDIKFKETITIRE
jgi:beta-glucosidase